MEQKKVSVKFTKKANIDARFCLKHTLESRFNKLLYKDKYHYKKRGKVQLSN